MWSRKLYECYIVLRMMIGLAGGAKREGQGGGHGGTCAKLSAIQLAIIRDSPNSPITKKRIYLLIVDRALFN